MSRSLPRRPVAASVQRRGQNRSSRAPSTNSVFETQLGYELDGRDEVSPGVIPDTPNRTSAHRHTTRSSNFQAGTSTSATPSQHSVEQPKQTKTHQRQPTILQAKEHTPELDGAPPPELLRAQRHLLELWTKSESNIEGLPPKVVQKGVLQAITSFFRDLKWDQSEPTRSQRSTAGLVQVGATERHSDLEDHASALPPDNTRGSQHGSKSPRDATGGVPLHREGHSSRLATPGGGHLTEQMADLPANEKGKSTPISPKRMLLLKAEINNEKQFREAFEAYGLTAIKVDGSSIDLFKLARKAVQDANPKFQARQQEQQERDRTLAKVNMTNEVWQVLFTIIANMFVHGPDTLYEIVKATSKQSSTGSSEPARRNRGGSNNAVAGPMSTDTLFKVFNKEKMEELSQSMRWWLAKDNKSEVQLEKVYDYYRKRQAVRWYDELISSWQNHEPYMQGSVKDAGRAGSAAAIILSYIADRITPSREEDTSNRLEILPEDSPIVKKISGKISGFRPICSLADEFGEGVLVLLINRAETYVLGNVGRGQEGYPQHERIRDMAQSLVHSDQRLRKLFTNLEEKVLNPVLERWEGGNAGNFRYVLSQKTQFQKLNVDERIPHILGCILGSEDSGSGSGPESGSGSGSGSGPGSGSDSGSGSGPGSGSDSGSGSGSGSGPGSGSDSGSDVIAVQERQRRSKRRTPHNSRQEAVDGKEGRIKRHRAESSEDEEAHQDGSERYTDSGDDIYNASD